MHQEPLALTGDDQLPLVTQVEMARNVQQDIPVTHLPPLLFRVMWSLLQVKVHLFRRVRDHETRVPILTNYMPVVVTRDQAVGTYDWACVPPCTMVLPKNENVHFVNELERKRLMFADSLRGGHVFHCFCEVNYNMDAIDDVVAATYLRLLWARSFSRRLLADRRQSRQEPHNTLLYGDFPEQRGNGITRAWRPVVGTRAASAFIRNDLPNTQPFYYGDWQTSSIEQFLHPLNVDVTSGDPCFATAFSRHSWLVLSVDPSVMLVVCPFCATGNFLIRWPVPPVVLDCTREVAIGRIVNAHYWDKHVVHATNLISRR